jgi:hypothetical protein
MDKIKCCSCDKEHEESGNCYYCGGMYGHGCDGVCLNCDTSMCQKCLDESQGAHIDRCNDCYLREYGDSEKDPDYPDDSKDAMAHKMG